MIPSYPSVLYQSAMDIARERQAKLTKPPGSLGRLEELSIQLAGISGMSIPDISNKAIVVMAGDHGVTEEGVSAYPSAVTPQMMLNFLSGGAAINVLANQVDAEVVVVDMGVAADLAPHPKLIDRKLGTGTANMARGPAMSREAAQAALEAGREVMQDLAKRGIQIVGTGEMGIGNTTAASAVTAALTGAPVVDLVGRGTGVDDDGLVRKRSAVQKALQLNQPDPCDPIDVLSKVGGYEIAGLAGLILEAVERRVPVVIDGFITGAAALAAARINPDATAFMVAAHRSVEIGHSVILDDLGLSPLLDLEMRLGEGTGAALAMHLLDGAVGTLREMATFESARVRDRE